MPDLSKLLSAIPDVRSGQAMDTVVTATRINAIQMLLRSLVKGDNLISGPGILKSLMTGGFSISSATGGGASGGAAAEIEHPFQIQDFSTAADPLADPAVDPEAIIQVRFGLVNNLTPTDVDTDFSLVTASSTYNVFVAATVDIDGVCTEAAVDATTAAVPADSDYVGYLKIGEVDVNDVQVVTAIRQACTHSLRMAMCGRSSSSGPMGETLDTRGTYEFWGF